MGVTNFRSEYMDSSGNTYAHHYPPALFALMTDVIPRLCRRKRDVLTFFQGAGVSTEIVSEARRRWDEDRDGTSKFEIARIVIERLNDVGDDGLRARRELIKRVIDFHDFSTCWPADADQAELLVGRVRAFVGREDTATRIHKNQEAEMRQRIEERRVKTEKLRHQNQTIAEIRRDFNKLFAIENPQQRGRSLEEVLNRYFDASGILVREAFALFSPTGSGTAEQIDGVIRLAGQLYLVEMKWVSGKVDVEDVSRHIGRVLSRDQTRGIVIANNGYTQAAVDTCREFLSQRLIVLCTLEEISSLLDSGEDLEEFLTKKIDRSLLEKSPL